MRLTDQQIELYSRQIILREVGGTGQQKLRDARVVLLGGGAAYDACASYLAGAGIGDLTVVPEAGAPSGLPALAPVASRTPEARVRTIAPSAIDSLDAYDVALWLPSDARSAIIGAGPTAPGRPRAGSVVLAPGADGVLELHLLGRDHGCVACVAAAGAPASPAVGAGDAPLHVIAAAGAGTLAALACCRWLVGIGDQPGAHTLRLPPGAVAWEDAPPPRRARCTRGCPPPDEPV